MAICKFWQQGNCRNGDNCRFEHPGAYRAPSRPNALGGGHDRGYQDNRRPGGRDDHQRERPYSLRYSGIKADLSEELPAWILSAYGPGFQAPAQLFGGLPREQSFEEMRVRHYQSAVNGQVQQAIQEAENMHSLASGQIQVALKDINGAIDYIISTERNHPNRIDICNQGSQSQDTGVFSRGRLQPANSLAQGPMPAFGQPSMPAQPNPFASVAERGVFGAGTKSPFPAAMRGFEPGVMPNQAPPNPFAAASAANHPNPFARASGGVGATPMNGFGQPSRGGFSQTFQGGSGQASLGGPGQPSLGGFSQPVAGAFGTPLGGSGAQYTGGSGALSVPQGFPMAAGAAQNGNSPAGSTWGANSTNQIASNPFSTNGTPQLSNSRAPGGVQPQVERDRSGKIRKWGDKAVSYPNDNEPCIRRPDGQWERIWFPEGEPARTMAQEIPLDHYDQKLEQQYAYLRENGQFEDGVIPTLPPKWEWTSWDF